MVGGDRDLIDVQTLHQVNLKCRFNPMRFLLLKAKRPAKPRTGAIVTAGEAGRRTTEYRDLA